MTLADTHVHLHFDAFDADRDAAVQRARDAGVAFFVNVGTTLEDSRRAVALAGACPGAYASVGVHPHDASTFESSMARAFEDLARHPRVRAIGEVGLDFYRNLSPADKQRQVFSFFLDLARRLELPVVIHSREAFGEVLAILRSAGSRPSLGVLHCFGGSESDLRAGLDLGLFVSFAGNVTYKKNDALRACARLVPIDRLLVETDAPFLAPQAKRGCRNEPAFMTETLACLAQARGVPTEELASLTTANARRLFRMEES